MLEYIKREDALAKAEPIYIEYIENGYVEEDEDLVVRVSELKKIPAADIVDAKEAEAYVKNQENCIKDLVEELERKTGKWERVIEQPYFRKHYHEVACSICHNKGREKWCYCPNCGARMVEDDFNFDKTLKEIEMFEMRYPNDS